MKEVPDEYSIGLKFLSKVIKPLFYLLSLYKVLVITKNMLTYNFRNMYNFKWIYIKICSISIIGKLLKSIRNKFN